MSTEKEFLYVGYYIDTENRFILKIGTTNDLDRRRTEHTRNYHRNKTHTLPPDRKFEYIWSLPLSKYNTLRFEDSNREKWINENIGEFVRNDRFVLDTPPEFVEIAIRKTYKIALPLGDFFVYFDELRQVPKMMLDICLKSVGPLRSRGPKFVKIHKSQTFFRQIFIQHYLLTNPEIYGIIYSQRNKRGK